MFKVLHCLLVFFGCSLCLEGAEISSFARLPIFLAGIQPILAGFQLPDHKNFSAVHASPLQILPSRVCSSDAPALSIFANRLDPALLSTEMKFCGELKNSFCSGRT
jgi:hypothetical protein